VQLFAEGGKATTTNGGGSGTDFASNQPHWLITNVYKNSTYELTVTSEACGLAATATMTVTVNQGASIAGISGGGTYCHGSEVTLFANNRSHGNGNVRTLISGLRVLFVLSALVAGPFTITLVSSFANGRLLSPNPSSFFSIQAVTVAAANINVVAANHFDIKCTHLTRWEYKVQCVNFAGSRLPLVRPRWFCSNLPNPYFAYATEGNIRRAEKPRRAVQLST
jgi:hypothetical protein